MKEGEFHKEETNSSRVQRCLGAAKKKPACVGEAAHPCRKACHQSWESRSQNAQGGFSQARLGLNAHSKPLNLVLFNVWKYMLAFLKKKKREREFQVCLQKYYFSLWSWLLEGHPILSLLTHLSLCLSKNVQARPVLSTTWSSCCFVCSTELLRCQTGWLLPTASSGWILTGPFGFNNQPLPSAQGSKINRAAFTFSSLFRHFYFHQQIYSSTK